jgi:pre-peptidase
MIRGCLVAVIALQTAGCSLILDFSNSAIPVDAEIDAPYTAEECMFKEPNDSPATAAVITPTDTGPAAICATGMTGIDDHDFYKFTVPANTTKVIVSIAFTNRPTGDLDLRLYNKTGTTVLSRSSGFGDTETITCPGASPACTALVPDDYVFEVFPALTGSVNDYTFSVMLTP